MTKLYVICGHGAGDSGSCGNGYQEQERVRTLAAHMQALGGSEVVVLDTSRNWYADAGINRLNIPYGDCLIELHLDSGVSSARGGHVIIWGGGAADKYDRALAEFISGYFPGRANTISKRTDLANPNRAAARGINYRLIECCFISNADDMRKFNNNIEEVAAGILAAFGIGEGADMATPKETWEYQYKQKNNYSKDGEGTGNSSPNMYNFLAWTFENVNELRKAVDRLEFGGIDYEKLAKAVCDEQARRLKD